jgi:hypothetical protein
MPGCCHCVTLAGWDILRLFQKTEKTLEVFLFAYSYDRMIRESFPRQSNQTKLIALAGWFCDLLGNVTPECLNLRCGPGY